MWADTKIFKYASFRSVKKINQSVMTVRLVQLGSWVHFPGSLQQVQVPSCSPPLLVVFWT